MAMALAMVTHFHFHFHFHGFPANGRQGSQDFAGSCIFPALRCNWRPWRSCDNHGFNLGFGRPHTGVSHRQLATCSVSNLVPNSMEMVYSARWAALTSVQVPLWIGVGSASGEEILEQIKGEAEEDVLVNGDGSQFITVLLYTAIAGLSLLTIGVIYLAVTEFLEKRERQRLLKEEEGKKKKENKPGKVKIAKSGPRGFGQKLQEDD